MPGAVTSTENGLLVLVLVLCAVMISLALLRRSQHKSATVRDVVREQQARLRDHTGIRRSMDDLLLQLEEVSRRINAQVDTKFVKLERVIRDADERIARLEGVLARFDRVRGGASTLSAPPAPPVAGKRPTNASALPERTEPPSTGRATARPVEPDVGRPLGKPRSGHSAKAGESAPGANERFRDVYELADAGRTAGQIAETLGKPLGEVELILNLREFG
ncbi:MAG: hypothetical protein KKB50_08800 [Planctomycetes bacterium]|nr:hypothetical protein [Planctomycetota bacterium]